MNIFERSLAVSSVLFASAGAALLVFGVAQGRSLVLESVCMTGLFMITSISWAVVHSLDETQPSGLSIDIAREIDSLNECLRKMEKEIMTAEEMANIVDQKLHSSMASGKASADACCDRLSKIETRVNSIELAISRIDRIVLGSDGAI